MTIILFLVDTSASMNQRTHLGTTVIDVAKGAVESFLKVRSRDPNSRGDRYMLLTFEDPPANVKAGWKEPSATLHAELKNLKASGQTTMGNSLKNAFDLLNLYRMANTQLDNYGYGRNPYCIDSAVIIVITDGGALTYRDNVEAELQIAMNSVVPGSELTKEPFRWDHRVFSIVIQFPASIPPDSADYPQIPFADRTPIDTMCVATAGRSYAVFNKSMLNAALDSLCQKIQHGVVVQFDKLGPDPPPVEGVRSDSENGNFKENQDSNRLQILEDSTDKKFPASLPNQPVGSVNQNWQSIRRMIYVPRTMAKGQQQGHWPIPESFWPDINSPTLPPRTAHPQIRFTCQQNEPIIVENVPFDKYELEPSPLTQYLLERRQPNVCWQVFIPNSGRYQDTSSPFGYLKASSSLTTVNLFVMPYNYPVILLLLDELVKIHKLKPTPAWRERFEKYIKAMPGYYYQYLRKVLTRMGATNYIVDNHEFLSYSVITYLKKLKNQAKVEMDRVNASVGQKQMHPDGILVEPRIKASVLQRRDFTQLLASAEGNMSFLKQKGDETSMDQSFFIAVPDPSLRPQCYRNAYDISRKSLLDQVSRMRKNLLQTAHTAHTLMEQEERHNVPVQIMGNYQKYLEKQVPQLRQVDNKPERVHTFGNPFKVNKQNMMVDEAEDVMLQGNNNQALKRKAPDSPAPHRANKRKPGPLPRGVPYTELASPLPSPPSSPSYEFHYENDSAYTSDEEKSAPTNCNTLPLRLPAPSQSVSEEEESMDSSSDNDSDSSTSSTGSSTSSPAYVTSRQRGSSDSSSIPSNEHSVNSNHLASDHSHSNGEVDDVVFLGASSPGVTSPGGRSRGRKRKGSNGLVVNGKEAWLFNCRLRSKVCKAVKKPGKDFSGLFKQLSTVQGSLDARRSFVQDIAKEAMRFKRSSLVSLLKQFEESLVQVEKSRKKL